MPTSDLHSFTARQPTLHRPTGARLDGCNENLPWPSYRRAVDLILMGHAKGTCLNGANHPSDHVSQPLEFHIPGATFVARTIRLEQTQTTKAESAWCRQTSRA